MRGLDYSIGVLGISVFLSLFALTASVHASSSANITLSLFVLPSLSVTSPSQTTDTTPTLAGLFTIYNADLFLRLDEKPVAEVIHTDNNYQWSWTAPKALSPGTHTLSIIAEDPNNVLLAASTTFQFEVIDGPKEDVIGDKKIVKVYIALAGSGSVQVGKEKSEKEE